MTSRLALLSAALLASASPSAAHAPAPAAHLVRFSSASYPSGPSGGVSQTAIDGPSSLFNNTFITNWADACGSLCPGVLFTGNTINSDIPGFTAGLVRFSSDTLPPSAVDGCATQGLARVLLPSTSFLSDAPQSSIPTALDHIAASVPRTGTPITKTKQPALGDSIALDSGAALYLAAVAHRSPAPAFNFHPLGDMLDPMSASLARNSDSRGVLQHVAQNRQGLAFYATYNSELNDGAGPLSQNDWRALLQAAASILTLNRASEVTLAFQNSDGSPVLVFTVGGADI